MTEPSADNKQGRFVFLDPHGQRWPRLRRVLVLWGLIAGAVLVWFTWSLIVRPELRMPRSVLQLKAQLKEQLKKAALQPAGTGEMAPEWQANTTKQIAKFYQSPSTSERLARSRSQPLKSRAPGGEVRLGFYVDWDLGSFASLEEHAGSLTHVAPEWLSLVDTEGRLLCEPEARLSAWAPAHGITLMPLLTNLAGDIWQPEAVENLALGSIARKTQFSADLVAKLKQAKCGGVILDWEQIDPAYSDDYTALISLVADALHAANMELWVMVSPGEDFETFDLAALQSVADRFVAILHDESSETDPPGPVASLPWIQSWLSVMHEFGDPSQWIGVLGAYGYDWNTTTKKTETLTFKDAMSRANFFGVDQGTNQAIAVDAPAYNAHYLYSDPEGEHTVSFLDAISFYNQTKVLRAAGIGGVGIQRLGAEDPAIWDVLDMPPAKSGPPQPLRRGQAKLLSEIKGTPTITNVGKGEVVSVDPHIADGRRTVETDTAGLLKATYTELPAYPILYHEGASSANEVAITFDDGPDPTWTPKILDILRERGVHACFFLIGQNAEDYPGLVARIVREGHEVGNHTYSHANLATMVPWRMKLELNTTQRIIESITGLSTTLFRPPYNADSTPTSMQELIPLTLAQDLGYTIVLEKIDPQDWAKPGEDVILQRVKDQRNDGNIILLHDAGGDRSQTVAALPRILDYLAARGDRVVSMSELLNIPRAELMPPANSKEHSLDRVVAGTGFRIWHVVVEFFWAFMICATVMVVLRTVVVAWLASKHHQRTEAEARALHAAPPGPPAPRPSVSVVMAAYNEAKVIAKTLRSITDTDYTGDIEFLVIDDGSKDETAAEVERFAKEEPRLRLIPQANGGKSSALRNGVQQARHDILVFLDADTMFEKGTITALTAPFVNPLIGAVSGNARVGNLRSFIARCQALEYICGFNLDRRAYTEWNCITVVPGAVSAMRRSAVLAAGGFSHDTLAEDTDLTLTLHRLHYRMEFAPDAIAWTEAPETYRTLARQRFRWAFGTMQSLWKHRDLVFSIRAGALGWFALPCIWFFQIGLVALTPLVDGILLWSIFFGHAAVIWYYFVIFLFMEVFLSLGACWMEGEPYRRAWIAIPMRLVYRPLLAWVIWRSIFRAMKGAIVGWEKLERTASVPSRK